ncbi:uncharacterized protein MELLADRAFT_70069 [Melampsora larici-populina 98AG31]|uniref:F-box domain-containing protein n=1 Tax=Melampsora larici-populina (strain 98AG31 / pathotype 3-4-7) TaxID=747676 RepID=F4SDF9_MELLP|nr:uncharacterized protein MELLADRAFT_70069 [Melampsora larici-populina 98AG31]EGF97318.1 hypothetical protein MELLADRAFT_70069 [Melampsora larici-populina 98AG31]
MSLIPFTSPPTPRNGQLPVEVVELILQELMAQNRVIAADPTNCANTSSLHHVDVTRLLQLRLIGKSWDNAILPIIFRGLRLTRNKMTSSLVRIWTASYLTPGFPHLNRLYLDGLRHLMPNSELILNKTSHSPTLNHTFSILPHNAASIINLCRSTITHLKLRFVDCVGFTPELLNPIISSPSLHTLNISGSRSSETTHDFNSTKSLLEAIPGLQSLSLNFSCRSMNIAHTSLSNLEHLWFSCDPNNLHTATNICCSVARRITCLELFPQANPNPAASIPLGLKDTLEVLFVVSIPDCVPRITRRTSFSKLWVLRSEYCKTNSLYLNVKWLKWPLLQLIEVLVTSYWHGNAYWRNILTHIDIATITIPSKLQHIVFTTPQGPELSDPELVEAFQKIGLKCHFVFPLTRGEIMTLADLLQSE